MMAQGRDSKGRFASGGGSRERRLGPVQQQIKKLEGRIQRQQTFLKRASVGRYSAREIAIEKDALRSLRSQLAGLKSRKH